MESYLLAAVVISGIALVMHAIASIGILLSVRKIHRDVAPLIPEAKATLIQAQKTLSETARDVREVTDRARDVIHSAQVQLANFDEARGEMVTHLKVQGERVELVVDDILSRVQEVVDVVSGSVLRPVREVSGIVSGVKTAVRTFMMGRRPTVERATHDDEMFI